MTITIDRCDVLRKKLVEMRALQRSFYREAQKIGIHAFLELAGFMHEQIRMYEIMLERGVDFEDNAMQAEPHMMAYIAEKLDCIFGEALKIPENRQAFLQALADKGRWPTSEFSLAGPATTPRGKRRAAG